MSLIQKAIDYAAVLHGNQLRKGSNIPYISHPFGVGMILMEAGCQAEWVAAGILHDTLEDTEATEEALLERFGPEVTRIVVGCTEPDKSLSWEERKQYKLDYLKKAPLDIKTVACADKLHNMGSTLAAYEREGEKVWERFNRGRKQQEWYYMAVADSLGHEGSFPLLDVLNQKIEAMFGQRESGDRSL